MQQQTQQVLEKAVL